MIWISIGQCTSVFIENQKENEKIIWSPSEQAEAETEAEADAIPSILSSKDN